MWSLLRFRRSKIPAPATFAVPPIRQVYALMRDNQAEHVDAMHKNTVHTKLHPKAQNETLFSGCRSGI